MLIGGVARRSGCVAGRAREKLRQRGAEKGEGKGEREAAGRARGVGHGNIRCAGGGKLGKTVRAGEGNRVFQGKASEVGNVLRRSATCAALCEYEPLFVSAPPGEKQHRIPEKAASREHLARSAAFCEGQHPSGRRGLASCRALFGARSRAGRARLGVEAPVGGIRRIFWPCADAAADCRPDAACRNTVRVPPMRRWRRILSAAR